MTKAQLKQLIKEVLDEVTVQGVYGEDKTPFRLSMIPRIGTNEKLKFAGNYDLRLGARVIYDYIQNQYNIHKGKPHEFTSMDIIKSNQRAVDNFQNEDVLMTALYVIGRYFGYSVIFDYNTRVMKFKYDGKRLTDENNLKVDSQNFIRSIRNKYK